MKRIYSIDFFKLLFVYLIALSHIDIRIPGYECAVVFFFILSGYFLARKFYSKKAANIPYSGAQYTLDHIKSLYPHYILSFAVMLAYFCVRNAYHIHTGITTATPWADMPTKIYNLIPELFMMQNIGFFDGGINYPLWQVSTLVISGYFIYTLLRYNEKLSTQILFPVAILLIQVYLKGDIDTFGTVGIFYIPMVRAFSAISFGVLVFKLLHSEIYAKNFAQHKLALNICSILSLVTVFVFHDNQILLITSVFIIAALVEPTSWLNKIFNHKIFSSFGELSYAVYLNHALIVWFMYDFAPDIFRVLSIPSNTFITGAVFFTGLTVYSVITLALVKLFKKKREMKKEAARITAA